MFDGFYSNATKAPEFPTDFDWINTDEPLSIEKLKGHVVVLDFWTYCCINCMHTLPVLAHLEEKYAGKPVVFIGIHSAKFFNEQDRKNVEHAVQRYEISHPVLVDREMTTWNRFGVSGWPTIVIIDPRGTVVYKQSGEGQGEMIEDMVEVLLDKHEKSRTLAKEPLTISSNPTKDPSVLSFPGKLAISDGMMAISDSNHNRVVIADLSGKIRQIIGGKRGFRDGGFSESMFFRPQGVAWKDGFLYVADTENHAIRKVDFSSRRVSTVAGTGKQGPWISGGGRGTETALSSPWDLAAKDGQIFIAMAGNHQIWVLDEDTCVVRPYAGNGHEDIVDGNRANARLAQPSGLVVDGDNLYFADSETSSIRQVNLSSGIVATIAGHGLFVFGHKDGPLAGSLFQHPLGLCALNGQIFVADTYNSAIREINLEEGTVSTIIGGGKTSGSCRLGESGCDSLGLYEPSDVKAYQGRLYISDTNNHLIRVYDPDTNMLKTLEVSF